MYRLASAMCLAFALLAVPIQARQTPAQQKQQQRPQARPNMIENLLQLDANGDQTIDREEVPESAREAFDKILEQADRNHNSKLEAEEVRAALESLRGLGNNAASEAQARFKAMDADNDGKVSKAEFKGPEAMYSRLDANADGFIDDQEAAQAYRQMTASATLERLKRLDSNSDGKISRDEFPGPDEAFNRLDANNDGVIDPSDRPGQPQHQPRPQPEPQPAAAEPRPEETPARPTDRPFLSRMDSDSDGKITKQEFKGPAPLFDRLDANADGVISSDEFPSDKRPNRPRPGANRARPNAVPTDAPMFMRLDKNRDGKVTRDEAEGRAAQLFDRLDTNADGAVTTEEAARAASRFQFRDRRPAATVSPAAGTEPEPATAQPAKEAP